MIDAAHERRAPLRFHSDVTTFGEMELAHDHTRAFYGNACARRDARPIVERLRAEIVSIVREPARSCNGT
jgi:hypothetical protein